MTARTCFIVALCLAYMASGVLGLHDHGSSPSHGFTGAHSHAFGHDDHDAHHGMAGTAVDVGTLAEHGAHFVHDQVDLDQLPGAAWKASTLAVAALLALLFYGLRTVPLLMAVALPPPYRPPRNRARFHLVPPSQAPPRAA